MIPRHNLTALYQNVRFWIRGQVKILGISPVLLICVAPQGSVNSSEGVCQRNSEKPEISAR